jgi:hypothetical protein
MPPRANYTNRGLFEFLFYLECPVFFKRAVPVVFKLAYPCFLNEPSLLQYRAQITLMPTGIG